MFSQVLEKRNGRCRVLLDWIWLRDRVLNHFAMLLVTLFLVHFLSLVRRIGTWSSGSTNLFIRSVHSTAQYCTILSSQRKHPQNRACVPVATTRRSKFCLTTLNFLSLLLHVEVASLSLLLLLLCCWTNSAALPSAQKRTYAQNENTQKKEAKRRWNGNGSGLVCAHGRLPRVCEAS